MEHMNQTDNYLSNIFNQITTIHESIQQLKEFVNSYLDNLRIKMNSTFKTLYLIKKPTENNKDEFQKSYVRQLIEKQKLKKPISSENDQNYKFYQKKEKLFPNQSNYDENTSIIQQQITSVQNKASNSNNRIKLNPMISNINNVISNAQQYNKINNNLETQNVKEITNLMSTKAIEPFRKEDCEDLNKKKVNPPKDLFLKFLNKLESLDVETEKMMYCSKELRSQSNKQRYKFRVCKLDQRKNVSIEHDMQLKRNFKVLLMQRDMANELNWNTDAIIDKIIYFRKVYKDLISDVI